MNTAQADWDDAMRNRGGQQDELSAICAWLRRHGDELFDPDHDTPGDFCNKLARAIEEKVYTR